MALQTLHHLDIFNRVSFLNILHPTTTVIQQYISNQVYILLTSVYVALLVHSLQKYFYHDKYFSKLFSFINTIILIPKLYILFNISRVSIVTASKDHMRKRKTVYFSEIQVSLSRYFKLYDCVLVSTSRKNTCSKNTKISSLTMLSFHVGIGALKRLCVPAVFLNYEYLQFSNSLNS